MISILLSYREVYNRYACLLVELGTILRTMLTTVPPGRTIIQALGFETILMINNGEIDVPKVSKLQLILRIVSTISHTVNTLPVFDHCGPDCRKRRSNGETSIKLTDWTSGP